MPEILNALIDLSMIIGPVIGYIYQYWLILKKGDSGTFSIDVCGILLFANITRMNFRLFKQYQTSLFLQSILMITVQLFLLEICKRVQKKDTSKQQQQEKSNQKSYLETFWRWPTFIYYFIFVAGFAGILTGISYLMLSTDSTGFYGTTIGLLALATQSILILPQIIKNYQAGKVKGVSHLLLSFNLFGDIFKLTYFLIKNQPFQFIMCGITQVILDTFVIGQIFYYRKMNKKDNIEGDSPDNQVQNQIQQKPQILQQQINDKKQQQIEPPGCSNSHLQVKKSNNKVQVIAQSY